MDERKRILEAAREAARIVKTWPLWKQNLLMNSLSPTCPTRKPVTRRDAEAVK